MSDPITVRFSESERYDINIDAEVVRMMATTSRGSYHAEVVLDTTGTMREARRQFKDRVVDRIQQGIAPCEIELGEYNG
jgi:hypothetical protein